jgi:hypothetical protein
MPTTILGISPAYGHIVHAIVIAVVMLPGISLLLLWAYVRTKPNAQQRGDVLPASFAAVSR